MAYDPTTEHLSERDASFLAALRDKFLKSLLAKVGPNSIRGHFIGKLLDEAERRGISWHAVLARQLPATLEVAKEQTRLTHADLAAIDYSRKHAAEYISQLADETMQGVRDRVTAAVEAKTPPQELSRQLFDQFGAANLDWRRIALTETGIAVSNGYLASLPEWTVVVGDSSADACEWCLTHIHNRAFRTLREPPVPADGDNYSREQSENYVWVGKTNIGRSQHARRRDGSMRTAADRWHVCTPAHPHCRCRFRRLIESVEMIEPGTNRVVPKV